jgi:hypothetical protein
VGERVNPVRISLATRIVAAAGLLCLLTAGAVAGSGAALAASQSGQLAQSGQSAQRVNTRFSVTGQISAVSATSASNAWAVGYSGIYNVNQKTLLLHWNGSKWTPMTTPKPVYGELDGVYATSPDNAWAVGFTSTADGDNDGTLILHWNGKTWSRDAPTVPGYLMAVDQVGNNVWTVGETYGPALVMHRTGGRWYVVPSPGAAVAEFLCVAVTGPNSAWAGGQVGDGANPSANLLLHWNGSQWKPVSSPMKGTGNGVFGLATGPSGTVLAVGNNVSSKTGNTTPLSMVWNGKTWRKVPVPGSVSGLGNVGSVPGGNPWAVGNASNGPAILHWTGKAWRPLASPQVASQDYLYGVAASSTRNAWAVGTSATSDSDNAVTKTLILHWNGKAWS